MKALRLMAWQQDATLEDVPDPKAGPGQVVIRIGGAGACHSDLHLMHEFGEGMLPWGPPFTLGHENAGWVEELGAGVSGLEVGEAVAVYGPWGCGRCHRCRQGAENYCEHAAQIGAGGGGLGLDGGMAPYMLVPDSRLLVPLGDLDPVLAAPLTDAGLTPYHAVKRALPLLVPGSTAVVIGVGGLGHMAVQLLDALSATNIIAVDQRKEALATAAQCGASHQVTPGDHAAEEITELTHGRGADVVIDLVGSDDTLALGAAVTRPMGQLTIVGLAGGTLPVSFFGVGYEVSVATTYWGTLPEMYEVIALAAEGHISPQVTTFDLDHATEAYTALQAGLVDGRAVIVPR